MPGKNYNTLFELATDQYGYVTTEDAEAVDVPAKRVAEMAHHGTLDHVAHGVYRVVTFPRHPLDQYMEATLWPRGVRGVLSHETALDLHDLCDVNPAKLHITVPKRWRTNREVPEPYVLHQRDLDPGDVTYHEGIPIVTPARAILDGIETNVRADLVEQAIETARRRGLLARGQLELITDALS